MSNKQHETDFLYKSSTMISNITSLCNNLLQNAPVNYMRGSVKKITVILDRFAEYLKFSDSAELETSALETINVIDVVTACLKSANYAAHRKESRLTLKVVAPQKIDDENEVPVIEIPNCLPIMKQALFQIIDNAVKYSSESSELEIRIDNSPDGDPSRTAIAFSNKGPKVFEDEMDSIFDKSVRGENAEKSKPDSGFGIGLSLVDKIINCHKWIDAFVYAESGETEFSLNNIDYSTFTITINFNKEYIKEVDTLSDLTELREDIEMMFKHELAGSMPEITRLAYEIGLHCINSSSFEDSTKEATYELFDSILDFMFYLNGQNVAGRPIEMRNPGAADRMLDRFVRWVFVYRKEEKPPKNLWERVGSFSPLPLFNGFIVAAQMLAKFVVDNCENLILRSYNNYYEIISENDINWSNFPVKLFSDLLAESELVIKAEHNYIIISKKNKR